MTASLVIHTYRLPFQETRNDLVQVDVRRGDLLHLAMQGGEIHVWAAVDPSTPLIPARFRLVGTGGAVEPAWYHLGTVMEGPYVWHVFGEPSVGADESAIQRKSDDDGVSR